MKGYPATDKGLRRSRNEDFFVVDDDLGLYAVCDGMGGHAAGEIASRLAAETVRNTIGDAESVLADVRAGTAGVQALVDLAETAAARACARVYESARDSRDRAGMGCTLTLLLCAGPHAAMAHVGDTRLYLWRDGEVHQLSQDHTYVAELAALGGIPPERIKTHNLAHVLTRALGPQEAVAIDTIPIALAPGDRFLLCSDGLSNYFDLDGTELAAFMEEDNIEELPLRLVEFANGAGGDDNITVIALEVPPSVPFAEEAGHTTAHLDALASARLFDADFLGDLMRVHHTAETRHLATDELLVTEGEKFGSVVVVVQGRLVLEDEGGSQREVGVGDVLGDTAILYPHASRATVRAVAPTTILSIDEASARALALDRPSLWVRLVERLAAHLSRQLDLLHAGEEPRAPRI